MSTPTIDERCAAQERAYIIAGGRFEEGHLLTADELRAVLTDLAAAQAARDEAQQTREGLYKAMCGTEREEFNAAIMAFAPEEAGHHFLASATRMVKRAEKAEAELAALREDRSRLDWLEEQRTSVIPYWPDGNLQWEVSGFEGPTLRIAVDAARKEAGK